MKKLTVMLLVMTLVFGLAACGNASEKGSNVTETQAQSAEDTGAGNAELNKLYEKENAIIAKHQELWNTVFNNIDKDKAADAGEQNYGTFLETQLDHVKDQFSEADLKKLDKDIEEIKKIEDQVTELTAQMGTENSGAQSANAETSVFPSFQAKDLDGNKVDSSIFSQNAVTVVNFWFNGCTPCVEELPALNKLNEELKAKCNLLEYLTQRDIQTKNSGVNVRYRGKHRFFKGFNEFIKEKTRRCDNDFEKIERHVFF